jgi:hypothetical protein
MNGLEWTACCDVSLAVLRGTEDCSCMPPRLPDVLSVGGQHTNGTRLGVT